MVWGTGVGLWLSVESVLCWAPLCGIKPMFREVMLCIVCNAWFTGYALTSFIGLEYHLTIVDDAIIYKRVNFTFEHNFTEKKLTVCMFYYPSSDSYQQQY